MSEWPILNSKETGNWDSRHPDLPRMASGNDSRACALSQHYFCGHCLATKVEQIDHTDCAVYRANWEQTIYSLGLSSSIMNHDRYFICSSDFARTAELGLIFFSLSLSQLIPLRYAIDFNDSKNKNNSFICKWYISQQTSTTFVWWRNMHKI